MSSTETDKSIRDQVTQLLDSSAASTAEETLKLIRKHYNILYPSHFDKFYSKLLQQQQQQDWDILSSLLLIYSEKENNFIIPTLTKELLKPLQQFHTKIFISILRRNRREFHQFYFNDVDLLLKKLYKFKGSKDECILELLLATEEYFKTNSTQLQVGIKKRINRVKYTASNGQSIPLSIQIMTSFYLKFHNQKNDSNYASISLVLKYIEKHYKKYSFNVEILHFLVMYYSSTDDSSIDSTAAEGDGNDGLKTKGGRRCSRDLLLITEVLKNTVKLSHDSIRQLLPFYTKHYIYKQLIDHSILLHGRSSFGEYFNQQQPQQQSGGNPTESLHSSTLLITQPDLFPTAYAQLEKRLELELNKEYKSKQELLPSLEETLEYCRDLCSLVYGFTSQRKMYVTNEVFDSLLYLSLRYIKQSDESVSYIISNSNNNGKADSELSLLYWRQSIVFMVVGFQLLTVYLRSITEYSATVLKQNVFIMINNVFKSVFTKYLKNTVRNDAKLSNNDEFQVYYICTRMVALDALNAFVIVYKNSSGNENFKGVQDDGQEDENLKKYIGYCVEVYRMIQFLPSSCTEEKVKFLSIYGFRQSMDLLKKKLFDLLFSLLVLNDINNAAQTYFTLKGIDGDSDESLNILKGLLDGMVGGTDVVSSASFDVVKIVNAYNSGDLKICKNTLLKGMEYDFLPNETKTRESRIESEKEGLKIGRKFSVFDAKVDNRRIVDSLTEKKATQSFNPVCRLEGSFLEDVDMFTECSIENDYSVLWSCRPTQEKLLVNTQLLQDDQNYNKLLMNYNTIVNPDCYLLDSPAVLPSGTLLANSSIDLGSFLFCNTDSALQEVMLDHVVKVLKVYEKHLQSLVATSTQGSTTTSAVSSDYSTQDLNAAKEKSLKLFNNALKNALVFVMASFHRNPKLNVQQGRLLALLQELSLFGLNSVESSLRFLSVDLLAQLSKMSKNMTIKKTDIFKFYIDTIVSSAKEPCLRASCALGLGLVMQTMGNGSVPKATSRTVIDVLISLARDGNDLVHRWALYALYLVIDSSDYAIVNESVDDILKNVISYVINSPSHYRPAHCTPDSPLVSSLSAFGKISSADFVFRCCTNIIQSILSAYGPELEMGVKHSSTMWNLLLEIESRVDYLFQLEHPELRLPFTSACESKFSVSSFYGVNNPFYTDFIKCLTQLVTFNCVKYGEDSSKEFKVDIKPYLGWIMYAAPPSQVAHCSLLTTDPAQSIALKNASFKLLHHLHIVGVKCGSKGERMLLKQMIPASQLIILCYPLLDFLMDRERFDNGNSIYNLSATKMFNSGTSSSTKDHSVNTLSHPQKTAPLVFNMIVELLREDVESNANLNRWIKVGKKVLNSATFESSDGAGPTASALPSPVPNGKNDLNAAQNVDDGDNDNDDDQDEMDQENEAEFDNNDADIQDGEEESKNASALETVSTDDGAKNQAGVDAKPVEGLMSAVPGAESVLYSSVADLIARDFKAFSFSWKMQLFAISTICFILETLSSKSTADNVHLNLLHARAFQAQLKRKYNNNSQDAEGDDEYPVILQLNELIRIAFNAINSSSSAQASTATVANESMKLQGLELLSQILKTFAPIRDPDFMESSLLEQYSAQLNAGLTLCYSPLENSYAIPLVQSAIANTCFTYLSSGAVPQHQISSRLLKIMTSLLDKSTKILESPSKLMFFPSCFLAIRVSTLYSWSLFHHFVVSEAEAKKTSRDVLSDLVNNNLNTVFILESNILKEYAKMINIPHTSSVGPQLPNLNPSTSIFAYFLEQYRSQYASSNETSLVAELECFNAISNSYLEFIKFLLLPFYSIAWADVVRSCSLFIKMAGQEHMDLLKKLNANNAMLYLILGQCVEKLLTNFNENNNTVVVPLKGISCTFNPAIYPDQVLTLEDDIFFELLPVFETALLVNSTDSKSAASCALVLLEFMENMVKQNKNYLYAPSTSELPYPRLFYFIRLCFVILMSQVKRMPLLVNAEVEVQDDPFAKASLVSRTLDVVFACLLQFPSADGKLFCLSGAVIPGYLNLILLSAKDVSIVGGSEVQNKFLQLSGITCEIFRVCVSQEQGLKEKSLSVALSLLDSLISILQSKDATQKSGIILVFTVLSTKMSGLFGAADLAGVYGRFLKVLAVLYKQCITEVGSTELLSVLNQSTLALFSSAAGKLIGNDIVSLLVANYKFVDKQNIPAVNKIILQLIQSTQNNQDRKLSLIMVFTPVICQRILLAKHSDDNEALNFLIVTMVEIITNDAQMSKITLSLLPSSSKNTVEELIKTYLTSGPFTVQSIKPSGSAWATWA